MLIKVISLVLIIVGIVLYFLLNNSAVEQGWYPGTALIAIGLLLIPIHHIFSFNNKKPNIHFPKNILFYISLGCLILAGSLFGAIFLYEGLNGLFLIYPSGIAAVIGLLLLIISLFVGNRTK